MCYVEYGRGGFQCKDLGLLLVLPDFCFADVGNGTYEPAYQSGAPVNYGATN